MFPSSDITDVIESFVETIDSDNHDIEHSKIVSLLSLETSEKYAQLMSVAGLVSEVLKGILLQNYL